jgi:hypothetical protein
LRINTLLLGFLLVCSITNAATIAVVNDGGGTAAGHGNFDDAGYQFSTANDIDVTALGIWENGGLAESHQVSIYDLSGVLQISSIINPGIIPDVQGYGYVPLLTPFRLTAGTWFIGAYYNQGSADFMRDFGTAPVMANGLSFVAASVYYNGVSGFDPNNPAPGQGLYIEPNSSRGSFFGPSFQFDPAAIPEPGTLPLLALSVPVLFLIRKYKG